MELPLEYLSRFSSVGSHIRMMCLSPWLPFPNRLRIMRSRCQDEYATDFKMRFRWRGADFEPHSFEVNANLKLHALLLFRASMRESVFPSIRSRRVVPNGGFLYHFSGHSSRMHNCLPHWEVDKSGVCITTLPFWHTKSLLAGRGEVARLIVLWIDSKCIRA